MRSSLALPMAVAGLLVVGRAAAQEQPRTAFSWVRAGAADDCPSAGTLRARVRERLGYDPFAADAEVSLEATVAREGDLWTAQVYKRGAEGELLGERTLANQAPDCEALGEAVALALALAIDPEAAVRGAAEDSGVEEPVSDEEPAPTPAPEAPETEAHEAVPVPPPTHRTGERPRLAFGAAFAHELVPGIGYGFRLSVDGAITRLWRWTVGAELWPEREVTRDTSRVGVGLTQGSAGVCVGRTFARGALHGCGSLTLGALHVVVYDPVPRDPGDRVFLGLSASLRGSVRVVGPVHLGVWAAATVPLIDHDLFVEGNPSPIFSPAPVAPQLGVELLVAL